MGYKVGYSLSTMTSLLSKIETEEIYNTGWWKIESSSSTPFYVNNLQEDYLGNWVIDYASQIPDALVGIHPTNIMVYREGSDIRQMCFYKDRVWIRTLVSGTTWTAWAEALAADSISYESSEPLSPGNWALWFDTTGDDVVIKTYDEVNRRWVVVQPQNLMKVSVYDTTGKATDYYAYVNTAITTAGLDTSFSAFETHIENSGIHITSAERQNWNSAADEDTMQDLVDTAEAVTEETIESKVQTAHGSVTSQTTMIEEYQGTLDTHMNNTTIHPNATIQADWASRAAGDHTHILDGRVSLNANKVVSGTVDIARLPKTILERSVEVQDTAALLALTSSDVDEGDWVYVITGASGGFETYSVIDVSALGTMAAFKRFNNDVIDPTWANIQNKPTTLAGYGITDAYTKDEIDNTVIGPYISDSAQLVTDTAALKSVVDTISISSATITSIDASRTEADDFTSQINTLLANIGADF